MKLVKNAWKMNDLWTMKFFRFGLYVGLSGMLSSFFLSEFLNHCWDKVVLWDFSSTIKVVIVNDLLSIWPKCWYFWELFRIIPKNLRKFFYFWIIVHHTMNTTLFNTEWEIRLRWFSTQLLKPNSTFTARVQQLNKVSFPLNASQKQQINSYNFLFIQLFFTRSCKLIKMLPVWE